MSNVQCNEVTLYCEELFLVNLMKDRCELDVKLMCYFYSQLVVILVDACIHNVLTELVMSLINGRVDGQLCILLVGMVICLL